MENIPKVSELLKSCRSILFITGAGISAESGLPTYRGIGGLYESQDTEDGIPVETALAGEMLYKDPSVTWKYLLQIERNCRNATFNRAHQIIAEMERAFNRVWVLTQNVDGFHTDAGAEHVIEIHGNLHHLKCMKCYWRKTVKDFSGLTIPPKCPKCGFIIRPDVVLFGEMLPFDKYQTLTDQVEKGFDIYFWIGTTGVFPYIQGPLVDAKHSGSTTVEINPDDTLLSGEVDIKIPMKAGEALERIWKEYKEKI
ncbi:MAG: NAD-dependent deacylase [Candidatus Omnitrophica bacterium]|nr:NAD-dependent deacylase [Candidatus Omnitrophota bacterium]